LKKQNYDKHIASVVHIRAMEYQTSRVQNREAVREHQLQPMAATRSNQQSTSMPNIQMPLPMHDQNHEMSTGERYIWDNHSTVAFGDPGACEPDDFEMRRIENEMDNFGVWNEQRIGKELSGRVFEDGEEPGVDIEEDDDSVLASILRNAGACPIFCYQRD
jgi:hypothetical protein